MTTHETSLVKKSGCPVRSTECVAPLPSDASADSVFEQWKPQRATHHDICDLVTIHVESLPDDFLVRLGRVFLGRVLFPTLLESQRVRVYLLRDADRAAGFIITRVGLGGLIGEIFHHHPVWFFASSIPALMLHPSLLRDCISVVSQLRARRSTSVGSDTAELFLLAVAPWARRRGVGRALIEHSATELASSGVSSYRVLLHAANAPADAIYHHTGFIERDIHRFAGRFWCERERKLSHRGVSPCE